MKLIDFAEKKEKPSALQPLLDRLQEMLPFGQSEARTRQNIIGRFSRSLDNRFTLLCSVSLLPGEAPIPFILVGAAGLVVFDISAEQGIYRAKDESWAEMDRITRSYQPSRQNYIRHARTLAQKVNQFLSNHNKPSPEALPVMFFLHPGVHIESKNPAIRLVQIDGIERFIASLQQSAEVLRATDIKLIVDALEKASRPQPKVAGPTESEDFFGKDLGEPEKPAPAVKKPAQPQAPPRPAAERPAKAARPARNLPLPKFSKTQWIVLALILACNVVLLIGLIIFALLTA